MAIPLVGLLVVIISLYFLQLENQSAQKWVQHSLEVRSQIQSVRTQLEEAETGLRGYLLTGRRELMRPVEDAERRLPRTLDRLESMVEDDPRQAARVRRIEELSSQRLNEMAKLINSGEGQANAVSPSAAALLTEAEAGMNRLRAELAGMRAEEEQTLDERLDEAGRLANRIYVLIAAGVVLAPVGGIAAMLLFTAGIGRRVERLDRTAHLLAQGEPLPPMQPARDEIGRLERSLGEAAALLAHRETELRSARDDLELRVNERTAELARTNESLQAEIAERERIEENLRQATDRLRAVIQASPLPIVGVDLDGKVKSWNRAAEHLFGWTEEEALGRTPPIIRPEALEDFHATLRNARTGMVLEGAERTHVRKDGSIINTRIWTAQLLDAAGEVNGKIAIILDVTERNRLEEQLFQAQKMEAIGRLAGGVAHDFNNLITVISGYGQMVFEGVRDNDQLREAAQQVLEAADRAAALAGQLLAFSRRGVIQLKTVDLNALVGNVERMLRRVIGEDIELKTVLRPNVGLIKADPGQIEQVVMNLAVNARDAMPQGGKLIIETASVELDETLARTHGGVPRGIYAMLAVSDTGQGMDPDTKRHLFEPFFTTKERGKGTGLGLSTVYGIVKQHGGDIWVYSERGLGSTFKVYLPQAEEPAVAAAEAPAPAAEELQTGHETILLAEDEDGVRRLVRGILEQHGYKVIEARDGAEALKLWERHEGEISLLITDLVMPNMSGERLAEALSLMAPDLKVLYLSGYTDHTVVSHGMLQAGVDFLEKPFTPETLSKRVRKILDSRKA